MANPFAQYAKSDDIKGDSDVLGYTPIESDIYKMTIEMAYLGISDKGAYFVDFIFAGSKGIKHKEKIYISSNLEKGQKPFYEKDGVKLFLPGFNSVESISLLTTGKHFAELDTTEKTLKIYNYTAKEEVPTLCQVFMDFIGTEINLGITQVKEDTRIKNKQGAYVASGKTKTTNYINKLFSADTKLTVSEIRAGVTEPDFYNRWLEKNQYKLIDKSTQGKSGNTNGTAPVSGTQPVPTSSVNPFLK